MAYHLILRLCYLPVIYFAAFPFSLFLLNICVVYVGGAILVVESISLFFIKLPMTFLE